MPAATQVGDGVYRLGTWLVNWYLIEDQGSLTVVDTAVRGYRPQLDQALSELGRSITDIDAVVLTHPHGDHIGLAEHIRREAGARVLVPAPDEQMARTGKIPKRERGMLPYLRHPMAWRLVWHLLRTGGARVVTVKEFETFADGAALDVPGGLRAVATPGHTRGHVVLHAERSGIVFVGDALCSLNPLTGNRGPQLMPAAFTESVAQATASLDRLAALDAGTLLFGHGEPWVDGAAAAASHAREVGPT